MGDDAEAVGGKVEVRVKSVGDEVTITVRDHGPGIASQYVERVFDRFVRLPQESGRLPGTGLGLAIARSMVTLHNGSIRAVNPTGGGCEMVVKLPRAVDPVFAE